MLRKQKKKEEKLKMSHDSGLILKNLEPAVQNLREEVTVTSANNSSNILI